MLINPGWNFEIDYIFRQKSIKMSFSVPAPYHEKTHLQMPAKARIFGKSPRKDQSDLLCSKCLKNGEIHEASGF